MPDNREDPWVSYLNKASAHMEDAVEGYVSDFEHWHITIQVEISNEDYCDLDTISRAEEEGSQLMARTVKSLRAARKAAKAGMKLKKVDADTWDDLMRIYKEASDVLEELLPKGMSLRSSTGARRMFWRELYLWHKSRSGMEDDEVFADDDEFVMQMRFFKKRAEKFGLVDVDGSSYVAHRANWR